MNKFKIYSEVWTNIDLSNSTTLGLIKSGRSVPLSLFPTVHVHSSQLCVEKLKCTVYYVYFMLLLITTLLSKKFIFAEVTMNVVIIPADEDDDAESSSRYNFFNIGFNHLP